MTERTTLWTVTDPRGMNSTLTEDMWAHILERHDDLLPYFEAVRLAVADPDEIYIDEWSAQQKAPGVGVEAYYKYRVLTSRLRSKMLYVSVKFVPTGEGVQGYVQTALPVGHVQARMKLLWKKSG
jgi:hypothetical protein